MEDALKASCLLDRAVLAEGVGGCPPTPDFLRWRGGYYMDAVDSCPLAGFGSDLSSSVLHSVMSLVGSAVVGLDEVYSWN